MAITNHERVDKSLTLVRDGIKPNLEKTWQGLYGDEWVEKVNQMDRFPDRSPSPDDLAFLLKGMGSTWDNVFRDIFGPAERGWVGELRAARNRWAHNERFSTDDAYRVMDTAERLLQSFSAPDQVSEVQQMKNDLLRTRFAEEARSEHRRRAEGPTKGKPAAGLAPWREVVLPHPDVREGRYAQAEFAADLFQVARGIADEEYQDPTSFFRRTFPTQGLRDLIVTAARRLSGQGGDPVVELQTNFGGGKTHSLIALHHLAGDTPATELPGVAEILTEEDLEIPTGVTRAAFVGQMARTSGDEKPDGTHVRTVWGEIAWQLGGRDAYELVREADERADNPGESLIELFELCGPALILIDEWVAYARQLPDGGEGDVPAAGDFDTQFTFAQTLTEAAAAVDDVLVLIAIPSSDIETGGERGQTALRRLKNVVSRVAMQWQPASADETFEIVRRRLFEPIPPDKLRTRDAVVRAFSDLYQSDKSSFAAETREGEYRRRMEAAYPIHPEFFDRLYEDWSTLDRFQRTRGVLRLMATVISKLWRSEDGNLLIMPGTLPMHESEVVSELANKYLEEAWEPIVRSDVDGPNSLPLRIDKAEGRLDQYSATRRVARAIYLGSAPKDESHRGVDLRSILLGCVQPGEPPGIFTDALRRLSDRATYLYVDHAQYWYSLWSNITRTALDRAQSNFTDDDADLEIRRNLQMETPVAPLGAIHVFPDGPGDVPDDDACLRLIVLPPARSHVSNDMSSVGVKAAEAILEQRQGGPRTNKNMLVFLAADANRLADIREAARQFLAWSSILEDRQTLDLTATQARLAETKKKDSADSLQRRVSETFQLALIPSQEPGSPEVKWEQIRVSAGGKLAERTATRLSSEEKIIPVYSGIRVRMDIDKIPLWSEKGDVRIRDLWSYYATYLYMPRLGSFDVLAGAISDGIGRLTWDPDAFAYAEAIDAESGQYRGLEAGKQIEVTHSPSALLVRPEQAREQLAGQKVEEDDEDEVVDPPADAKDDVRRRFYGRMELDPVRAIRDLERVIEHVVNQLGRVEDAETTITIEINASADGFDDGTQRTVSENAAQLGFETHEFEE